MRQFARGALILPALVVMAAAPIEWPKDYVVYEGTASPDERYGLIVLSRAAIEDGDIPETNPVYLADVTAHRVLGAIRNADYFEGQNHRGLQAMWNENSTACVVVDDGRYGFESITLVQPNGGTVKQSDIGKRIEKTLKPLINGYTNAYFDFQPAGKLSVRALSYTNPKQLDDVKSEFAMFAGTFEIATEKWSAVSARGLKEKDWNQVEGAFEEERDVNFENEEPADLERSLNIVYNALQVLLPPARFTKVKQEEIAWLKHRDAAGEPEKTRLTRERINALQRLLW